MPGLENLVMIGNPMTSLPEHSDLLARSFPNLSALNISDTNLQSWEEVEKLKHFPKLVNIRIQGLPFLEVHIVFLL